MLVYAGAAKHTASREEKRIRTGKVKNLCEEKRFGKRVLREVLLVVQVAALHLLLCVVFTVVHRPVRGELLLFPRRERAAQEIHPLRPAVKTSQLAV